MRSSWMIARLDAETRTHHRDADADRLSPLAVPASVAGYVSYLARILGFEAPVEEAVARVRELALLVEPSGVRTEWLVADLEALGADPLHVASLPRCPTLTIGSISNVSSALAWLYVIERNSSLHGVVRRHLARRMPGQIAAASAYLSGPEAMAAPRWRALGAALDEAAASIAIVDRIVATADTAFRTQRRWLRHLPMPELTGYRHL